MGERLTLFFKEKLKREYKLAFVSSFLISLFIHFYKFTNYLPNHDSLYNYYSDQNVLGSGRWALSIACGISSYYDLPWVNGIVSCVFIALTVVIIAALFEMKNPVLIILTGALLAASPSTTETFFFLFTADGYMIAMFLSALAVYCSRIGEKRTLMPILSGVCICVSCGIYQAYVSFALLLAVFYFADVLSRGEAGKKECIKWIIRQAVTYVVALVAYFVIWKLAMRITDVPVNDYQGISEVGKLSLEMILNGVISSVKTVVLYFIQWDIVSHGITLYGVLNLIFILFLAVGLVFAVVRSKIYKRKWAMVMFVLCIIAVVPFAGIWNFVSESVGYRAMMLESLTLLFVFGAVLYERWSRPIGKNVLCFLLAVVVFNNAIMANIGYFYMTMSYERTYADGIEMMLEIRDIQDEHEVKKIAVLGNRLEDVLYDPVDPDTGKMAVPGRVGILTGMLETTMLYDAPHTVNYLKNTFGMDLEPSSSAEMNGLLETETVREMECWPTAGSVAVIDDTVVIKLSERSED